jgi:hypothetical protein
LKGAVLSLIQQAAQTTAEKLHMPNTLVVDEATLGDFPWYWQSGTNFNAKTYSWLNNVFAYDATDGYVATSRENFITEYFNVVMDTRYALNAKDSAALNSANLANAAVANTVISDWTTTQGAIPSGNTTQMAQLNYIMGQVLTWGVRGLTLAQLRSSLNPMSLLPNIPLGGDQVVTDLMTYLAKTSSVANIQAAVLSANNQLAQTRANLQPAPISVTPGWMQIVFDNGQTAIVPQFTIVESTAVIQNNLLPTEGTGTQVNCSFKANKLSSNEVQVNAEGGAAGIGDIADLFLIEGEASAEYNLFSFDESVSDIDIEMQFNGVTTVTPAPVSYDVSTGTGWYNPAPIQAAVAYTPGVSGYQFTPNPGLDFGTDGNFGLIARLMISQQPIVTLTFDTSNYSLFTQKIQEQSEWGITFLGIPLAGGSQSYYQATTQQNSSANTVTITMTPAGITTPVSPTDQLAYVIGAQILWPGAASS